MSRDDTPDGERLARIFLTRVLEPGDETAGRWIREYGAEEVARRLRGTRARLPGVPEKRWAGLRARAERAEPERDWTAARETGMRFLCPGGPEWPAQLDDLGDARPIGLWVRGRPALRLWALRSVAVVGARACTEYGAHMAATLAAGLAECGWVVVSGGAYGVDGAAHRGALGAGGSTAAVLACGVDRPYPRGHTGLITRIAEQGLVIGELPPRRSPDTQQIHRAEPRHRGAHPRHRRRRGRPPQWLPGHGACRTATRPPHHGRARAGHQQAVRRSPRTAARRSGAGHGRRRNRRTRRRHGRARSGPARPRAPPRPAGTGRPARTGSAARARHGGGGRDRPRCPDQRGRRGRETVRTPITWIRRTTRRRLEVDTPGGDLRPTRSRSVLTQRVRPSGRPPTPLAIPPVDPFRRSLRATAITAADVPPHPFAHG